MPEIKKETSRDTLRRSGRTTRIIDACVQELFVTGFTKVVDHHNGAEASKDAFLALLSRLSLEHNLRDGEGIEVDFNKNSVKYKAA